MSKEKKNKEKVAVLKAEKDNLEDAIQLISFFYNNPKHDIQSTLKRVENIFKIFLSHEYMDDINLREDMLSLILMLKDLKKSAKNISRDKVLAINTMLLDKVELAGAKLERYE